MRVVSVENLKEGDVVGRCITGDDGRILLNADIELTARYIQALKNKGYDRVYIRDTDSEVDVAPDEDLDPQLRAQAALSLRKTFESIKEVIGTLRQQSFDKIKDACSSEAVQVLAGKGSPIAKLQKDVLSILDEVLSRNTLAGLTSLRSADTREYDHAIDVCVVALMIGKTIGQPDVRLRQLAMGCLLHDIGKAFIDANEDETKSIRQHTLLGFELLKGLDNQDIMSPYIAYEHHEHQDGSGEPRCLKGSNKIERNRGVNDQPVPTLLGEIAAVANAYDNLLSGTGFSEAMTPDLTLQALRNLTGTILNREIMDAFIRVVPVYPVGSEIIVCGKRYHNYSGLVTRISATHLDKPAILLLKDNTKNLITPIQLNLVDETDIQIRIRGF